VAEQFRRALSGQMVRNGETVLLARNGTVHWVAFNARRVDDYDAQPALLAVGHDVTESRLANERAVQAERLAAIGQMVAGLAHESRNALQRSKACLELLALEVEDRPEALDLVARIHKAQDHLHHLYEEVRSYAAPIRLKLGRCDLRDVWRETWASLSLAREGRRISLHEPADSAELAIDADQFALGQVFRNIFENAIAACADPGHIWIEAQPATLDGRPALQICIRDNGPGLDRDQQARIFEPFYTTKTTGTGLGMAIARRIVEEHHGTITVGPGPGAAIVLTLPR
jgi:hypothetical protein